MLKKIHLKSSNRVLYEFVILIFLIFHKLLTTGLMIKKYAKENVAF